MINKILSVVDRLNSLGKTEFGGDSELARKTVEPIFADLILVHLFYIELMEKTLELLELPAKDEMQRAFQTQDAKNYLREQRKALAPLKAVKDATNGHQKSNADSDVIRFVCIAAQYIYLTVGSGEYENSRAASRLGSIAGEKIVREMPSPFPAQHPNTNVCISLIQFTIRELQEAWSDVCVAYAKIIALKGTEQ